MHGLLVSRTIQFQPTHPSRGATRCKPPQRPLTLISTHAPLAGCDPGDDGRNQSADYFNPRTPRGVRPSCAACSVSYVAISTHAPLAGCDIMLILCASFTRYFNPRTPRGVRPVFPFLSICKIHFNPRTPRGVRPVRRLAFPRFRPFQPTHPSRGATFRLCEDRSDV